MARCKRCDGERVIKAIKPFGGRDYEFHCPECSPVYNEMTVTNWDSFLEAVKLDRINFPPGRFKIIVNESARTNA